MSGGASAATTAWDVGTQSISPKTKIRITSTITGAEPFQFRSRNGTPIIGIAMPSFTDGAMSRSPPREPQLEEGDQQRVDDHQSPQAAGARLCVVAAVSVIMVIVARMTGGRGDLVLKQIQRIIVRAERMVEESSSRR